MNRTKIDYVDYTWNPVTGCRKGCPYCYARRMSHRFRRSFEPEFHRDRMGGPSKIRKPSTIFVSSMGDLFGDGVEDDWINRVLLEATKLTRHTFVFLTKRPDNLRGWIFAYNCIVCASVGNNAEAEDAIEDLRTARPSAGAIGLSVEPIRSPIASVLVKDVEWVIVGCQTGPGAPPPDTDAVRQTIEACRTVGVPVFVKANTGLEGPREFPNLGGGRGWRVESG